MREYVLPVFLFVTLSGFIGFFFYCVFLILAAFLVWMLLIKLLNYKAFLFPLPLRRTIQWLHAMTFETLFLFVAFFLRPLCYFQNQEKFTGVSSCRPILLIHGYLDDSSAWTYIKRELGRQGFGPVYTLRLTHPFRSICSYAEFVREKAQRIAQETGRNDLILIGHSMGGLVSSWYATKLAPPGTVTDVITVGSPLAGTYVAYAALGPSGREMQPDSAFVKELQKGIRENKQIRFYHIGTRTDQLVFPASSSWLGDDLERQFVVDDIGHVSLLFSSRILNKICEWLRQGSKV